MSEHEQLFVTILRIGFCVLVPVGMYHRIKSKTDEKLDRSQEGIFILIALRLVGLAGIGGLIVYLMSPSSMAWASMLLPDWLRWVGVGIGVCGGVLLTWTLHSLGKNLTDTVVTRRDHTLVTHGPYRWVRHPFYVSAFLAIVANCLVAANWFFLVAGILFFTLISLRTQKEEQFLRARFGQQYESYFLATGRFVPRLGKSRE